MAYMSALLSLIRTMKIKNYAKNYFQPSDRQKRKCLTAHAFGEIVKQRFSCIACCSEKQYDFYGGDFKIFTKEHGLPKWCSWQRTCLTVQEARGRSWVRKIPWRKAWQPTLVFLPEKSMDSGVHGVTKSPTHLKYFSKQNNIYFYSRETLLEIQCDNTPP